MYRVLILVPVLLAGSAAAQEIHTYHCLAGCPAGRPGNDVLVREIYTLSSNDHTKMADWAAYVVKAETIGASPRANYKTDPWLDAGETLERQGGDDYAGANAQLGTDRGHQVPLASFAATRHVQDTNYYSNITPQNLSLNRGPWKVLEDRVRTLARRQDVDAVYVLTGPLFERAMQQLPQADESHLVPSGYWKVVALPDPRNLEPTQVVAFFFDQEMGRGTDVCDRVVSVAEVEELARLDLFPDLGEEPGNSRQLERLLGC